MISRCGNSLRYAREQSFAVMENFADFNVHQGWSPDDLSAKYLANRLMPQANAQDRYGFVKVADDVFSDPGIGRCSRSRRDHNPLRLKPLDFFQGDFIVAENAQVFTQLAKILNEVIGE